MIAGDLVIMFRAGSCYFKDSPEIYPPRRTIYRGDIMIFLGEIRQTDDNSIKWAHCLSTQGTGWAPRDYIKRLK